MSVSRATIPDVPRLGSGMPLVGRAEELAALTAAFDRAGDGSPGLVLVSGDAGVGKTRLLEELAGHARRAGALVLVGRCLEVGATGLPYLPFVEALGGTADVELLRGRPALARMLPQLDAEPGDDELGRLPLFDAVTGLLAELVRLPATDRLHVPPFRPAEADRFVRAVAAELAGLDLRDAGLRRVAERSEGNAFLAEELLATCTECGGEELPPALADVLLTRLEQLPAGVQQAVRAAAVGGRKVAHGRLRRVVGLPDGELDDALRGAVEHHVLVAEPSGDAYSFRHALMQEAVYGDLLPGQRARLHAGYAEVLAAEDGRGVAAELAHHSLASGALPGALTASVAAAEEASRLGAPAEVLRHLELALQLWSAVGDPAGCAGTDEWRLMARAGAAASAAGDPERALAHLRAAAAAAADFADPPGTAYLGRLLARQLLALELDTEAYEVARGALERLGDRPDEPEWPRLLVEHARAASSVAGLEVAERVAERAVRAARELDLPGTVADGLMTQGLLAYRAGRIAAAIALQQQVADLAAAAGALPPRLRALTHLGLVQFEHGQGRAALATIDTGVRLAEEAGLTWSTFGLELRVLQVLVCGELGEWDAAERAAEITSAVSGLVEARVAAAAVRVTIGRGRLDDAARQLAGLRRWRDADSQIALLVAFGEVELRLWRDDAAAAVAAVDEALERLAADPAAFARIRLCALALSGATSLASRARQRSDAVAEREAAATAERLHAHATAVLHGDRPWGRAPGPEAHAWSAVADAEHARAQDRDDPTLWARAANLFDFGGVYEQARCRWRQATALLTAGDRDAAAEPIQQAREVTDRLGARLLGDGLAQLAARAGMDRRAVASTPTQAPLTPREQAVLELVARGRANRRVGAELFISEKTVSVHLSRVMAKLGASSRTEAVAVAHARGLLVPIPG
ncbi:MAG: AAA family ATPase [Pseudonocardiaceae bacterium]|nr:AAA family ATPase [Pseudonocardiaceae bacterium]